MFGHIGKGLLECGHLVFNACQHSQEQQGFLSRRLFPPQHDVQGLRRFLAYPD